MEDNRSSMEHLYHFYGHAINSFIKSVGGNGIETSGIYRNKSPDKAKNGPWPKEVDDQRASYHIEKYVEKNQKEFSENFHQWLLDKGLF